jgi:hypothetical protein
MFNDGNKNWFRLAWHPPDEELLAFLDGELNAKLASKVQKHLEGCWGCRSKREKIERSISAFINYRNPAMDKAGESQARAYKRFADKLSGLVAKRTELPSDFFRLETPVRQSSYFMRVAMAAVVVFLVIGARIWFVGERTVSASELLKRAAQAEISKLNQVSSPVVHRKLQVRRRTTDTSSEEVTNWEVWSDSVNRRFAQRAIGNDGTRGTIIQTAFSQTSTAREQKPVPSTPAAPELLLELERVLTTNRMDFNQAVSAAAFQSWRQSIEPGTETVKEAKLADGEKALELATTVAGTVPPDGIAQASLVVRKKDWRPVIQRLRVKAESVDREYEITEIAHQLVSLSSLDTSIFPDRAVAAAPVAKATPIPIVPSPSPLTPASPFRSPLATAEIEVEILERLNQVGALLGEQLSLTRTPDGKLLLEGVVETDARKKEILQAMRSVTGNPAVLLEVSTVAEALHRQSPTGTRKVQLQDAQVAQQTIPVEAEMRNYFAGKRGLSGEALEQEIQRFSRQICSRSSRARSHALAIKKTAQRFTAVEVQAMDQGTRHRFIALIVEHAHGYRRELQQLREQLQPIFEVASLSTAGPEGVVRSDEDLLHAINRLFEIAAVNDAALCQSFSVSTEAVTGAAVKKPEFWHSFGEAENLAAQIAGRQ